MVLERMAYFGLLDDDGKIVTGGYKNTLLRRTTVPEERERYDLYYLSYFRKRHRFNSLKLIKPVLESAHESLEFLYNGQIFSITHLRADSAEKIDEALGLMTAAPLLNIRSRTEPLEELLDETRDIKTIYIMPDSNQYLKLVDAVEQKGLSTLIERTRIAVFKGYSPSGYDFKINFI